MEALGRDLKARRIRVLEDSVVNKIAAGEVVERPSSVVKELVENSIDAGADNLTVSVTNGGKSSIEVTDNGCGMERDDALLAIERFATSKLNSADDLISIATLGFRGEALPSIAAVSKFSLSTSTGEGPGTVIRIDGGKLQDVSAKALPKGTRIEVRSLFYNVPARRNFLRSERTEIGLIKAFLIDASAAYPHVRLRLVSDGEEVLNLASASDFAERLLGLQLAGRSPLVCKEELITPSGHYQAEGVLSQPIEAVIGGGKLRLIVNGRSVRDRILLRALRDGYGHFLKADRYPAGILRLKIPPGDLDVNVHPQKAEVRFRDTDKVFAVVRRAIQNAITGSKIPMPHSFSSGPTWREGEKYDGSFQSRVIFPEARSEGLVGRFEISSGNGSERISGNSFAQQSEEKLRPLLSSMRFVGQIFECYLLMEGEDRFAIVDMHAAHERITFARLKAQFLSGQKNSQLLLVPEVIRVPLELFDRVKESLAVLERLGFDCGVFGEDALLIRGVPVILAHVSATRLFDDLLSVPEWTEWATEIDSRWDSVLMRMACHGSVRSGRILERDEVYALLCDLQEVEAGAFCPHGRPVAKILSRYELECMFGRV